MIYGLTSDQFPGVSPIINHSSVQTLGETGGITFLQGTTAQCDNSPGQSESPHFSHPKLVTMVTPSIPITHLLKKQNTGAISSSRTMLIELID